ncbi:hypothetical protein SEA_COROFIN_19 [Mycobacterium phage Corofin]|uniref:Uncharacterized protein n=1 Tax=Mycobacterium phage Obutu TaxID=2593350 RepID=A0A514TXX1_9CAUD|nr:hypothetical protein KNU70_gp019 [Mycobacterium phage Obutu]AKG94818.1 hypothetical protein SEA_COROFIN_19 [Mycobacterium phage Corofin]AWY03734.1 hypothetical protein MORTCELLUS_18 [Mycobacterium phage Mortcellus]QDK01547.1 hypothetical protein OBUTU_19 [Mycobacterium phage Obutu]WGH22119.1 hypothetical protein SEA_KRONUS_18 [Mycobacterium phage Kronus]
MKRRFQLVVRHTRYVYSGSPPLYRLMMIGTVLSAVAQAFDRDATLSVASYLPTWADWLFIGAQFVAGLMVWVSLYLVDENREHATRLNDSLYLELLGLIVMQTVIAVNVVAVAFYYGRQPTGQGSWLQIMLSVWIWTRIRDILRTLRKLREPDEPEAEP